MYSLILYLPLYALVVYNNNSTLLIAQFVVTDYLVPNAIVVQNWEKECPLLLVL